VTATDAALPDPVFIAEDPREIAAAMIATYEAVAGKALLPAQPERLFIDWMAYQVTLLRMAMNEVGRQSLLAYARYPMLDYLGQMPGVVRAGARPAQVDVEVRMAEAAPHDRTLTGMGLRTPDGAWLFAQDQPLVVLAGRDRATATFTATTAGAGANGFQPGALTRLDGSPPAGVAGVTNTSATGGGAEREDDERLRARIQAAPERFSSAGPVGAYRWHALSAHPSIRDVAVWSPEPGLVRVVVLTAPELAGGGMPDGRLLDLVSATLSGEKVRPITDRVEVLAPTRVTFALRARVVLRRGTDRPTVRAALDVAAGAWLAERRAGLGRDLVPSQIVAALSVPGVYRVEIDEPAFQVLAGHQWADGQAVDIAIAADGADG
jgi:phage-related baseplate assembly protein